MLLKKFNYIILLLFIIIGSFSIVSAQTADIQPEINEEQIAIKFDMPEYFKQGNSLTAYIKTNANLKNPQMTFNGVTSKLYKINDTEYRGITATDAITKPGGYTLKVFDDSGKLNYSKVIEVNSGKYPIQNITISKSKTSLEPTEEETKKVTAAKELITDTAYWGDRPFSTPTSGCMISPYGRTRYHNGKPTGDFHRGIDIKAPSGNNIYATEGGKVIIADDKFVLHGKTVAIDHGQGLMSIYIHMSKVGVKEGDMVKKGDYIGNVGQTGFATGPHLHWGLYVNGIPVDPNQWTKPATYCR
ncbi:MAG: M23 family metallopeptidase [Vampirovibrionia bacterium]